MKAVLDIEWILGAFLFLTTISFIILFISNNLTSLQEQSAAGNLRSESYQTSSLLLLDEGYPKNWNAADVERIGLSTSRPYILNTTKINNLKTLCQNDYQKIRKLFGNDVIISVDYLDGNNMMNCTPSVISVARPLFVTGRVAVLDDNKIVKLDVSILG